MPSLATSEKSGSGGEICGNNTLDKFIQLVLEVIVAAFIFLLGLLLIGVTGKVYDLLNPTQTQGQKILYAVQTFASWFLTLVIGIIGYVLLFVSVFYLLIDVAVFFYQLIAEAVREAKPTAGKK